MVAVSDLLKVQKFEEEKIGDVTGLLQHGLVNENHAFQSLEYKHHPYGSWKPLLHFVSGITDFVTIFLSFLRSINKLLAPIE
jgi:hypothetical protein